MYNILSCYYRVYIRSRDCLFRLNENRIIKAKYQSIYQCIRIFLKNLQMESSTFRARIINYGQLAYKADMYFECQADFGRSVKISCITISPFIVILCTFFI